MTFNPSWTDLSYSITLCMDLFVYLIHCLFIKYEVISQTSFAPFVHFSLSSITSVSMLYISLKLFYNYWKHLFIIDFITFVFVSDGSNRLFAMSAKSRRIREKSFTESIDNDQYMSYIPPSSPDGRRNSLSARSPLPSITLSNEDNYQIRITSARPGSRTTSRAGSARPGSRGDRVPSARPGSRTSRPASRLTSSRPGSRDRLSDGFSSPVLDEARATSPKITVTIDNGEDSDILVIQESQTITQTVRGDTDSLTSLKDDITPRMEDRRVIQADTRQIHAVVKQKRSKQQNNLVNLERKYGTLKENKTLYRPQKGEKEIFLDQNALARHNKNLRGDKALPPVSKRKDSTEMPSVRKQNSQDSFSTKQTSVISDVTLPSMTDDTKSRGRKSEPARRKRYDAGFTRSVSCNACIHLLFVFVSLMMLTFLEHLTSLP